MSLPPLHSPVRVHPFTGLVIDVDTWATAHDYHRQHQQLHLLTLHGRGIAHGLEVLPSDPPSETVVVEAGVAIDALGNVIVVPERQHLTLGEAGGPCYIVLDYVESIPPVSADQKDTRARILEDFRLRVLSALPEAPAVELARVQLTPTPVKILSPANPWAPALNEIDGRFRLRLQSQAPRELSIGFLLYGSEKDISSEHLTGFQYFLRELEFTGLRANVVRSSDASVPAADIIYLTANGQASLPVPLIKRLSECASQGSWVFADPCGPGTEMVQSLKAMLSGDNGSAERTESLVLGARNVFGAAPPGAFPTREIVWGNNALISPRDYGCAWCGRRGDQVFQRDLIRSALEFGVNVAYSALRDVGAR